jgi:hypothetical protein
MEACLINQEECIATNETQKFLTTAVAEQWRIGYTFSPRSILDSITNVYIEHYPASQALEKLYFT